MNILIGLVLIIVGVVIAFIGYNWNKDWLGKCGVIIGLSGWTWLTWLCYIWITRMIACGC